jgi:hypothetical protein
MRKIVTLLVVLLLTATAFSQNNSLFLLKNGKKIRSFQPGDDITVKTVYGQWYTGYILGLWRDSIYINGFSLHIKEIAALREVSKAGTSKKYGTAMMTVGAAMLIGGAINGLYFRESPSEWFGTAGTIAISSLLPIGYVLRKTKLKVFTIGAKYRLQYFYLGPD